MLKRIRFVSALLIGVVITFYFLDFSGVLPAGFPNLARVQFVPALLAGSIGIVVGWLVLTWLFGRIYCSVICPLGIFQDGVAWIAKRVHRKKFYRFQEEKPLLRYGILVGVTITFLLGITVVLSLLDPYSAFGRMAVNVFRPVYMAGNNLLAVIFNSWGNYTFYHTDIYILRRIALVVGLLTLAVIGGLAWRYGRSWCNTVCPVGTLLGMVSRYSLWKVRIDPAACGSCGLCERRCKASCIDSRNKKVDSSRCVDCYNCLAACHRNALRYTPVWKKASEPLQASNTAVSRRQFVTTLAAFTLAAPTQMLAQGLAAVKKNKVWEKKHPLSPPGSVSAAHLLQHCTACHLCIAKCPSKVLKPAFLEYGWEGILQPQMDFEHGFCNFDCTVCTEVCPNGALLPLTKTEKHRLQMGKVVFVRENCIVYTEETSCGACSEHCPTQAVSMVAYKNGLTIPQVNPEICVGCGGCEYVCPVRPFRAIYIEGNPVHQQAKAFEEAEKKEIQLDDFGF